MLTHDTQKLLANTIMIISREQQGLETIKQILAQQQLFTPYTAFLRISRENQGYLTKTDIQIFLE